LRLQVGVDGTVKQVRVTNPLPDGLTEEAMRVAYQMKFTPATKGGEAVTHWIAMQLEFNIR
jgi:TonB family protein